MGDTPYRDLVPLCSIVKWKSPKKIFEFGTFSGLTSLSMLVNCENDARLWTLDLDPNSRRAAKDLSPWDRSVDDTRVGGFFRDTPYSERIEQLFGDSLEFDTTPFRKAMDLIFIDASHELKYVESDTEKALEMLAPGGIVVWHDYPNADGVRACLNENAKKYPIVQLEGTIIAVYCSSSASE
jgi:predicted O-methyltransferase YrrM